MYFSNSPRNPKKKKAPIKCFLENRKSEKGFHLFFIQILLHVRGIKKNPLFQEYFGSTSSNALSKLIIFQVLLKRLKIIYKKIDYPLASTCCKDTFKAILNLAN